MDDLFRISRELAAVQIEYNRLIAIAANHKFVTTLENEALEFDPDLQEFRWVTADGTEMKQDALGVESQLISTDLFNANNQRRCVGRRIEYLIKSHK